MHKVLNLKRRTFTPLIRQMLLYYLSIEPSTDITNAKCRSKRLEDEIPQMDKNVEEITYILNQCNRPPSALAFNVYIANI